MTGKIGVHRIVTGSNSKSAWRLDGWRRSDVPDDETTTNPMRKRDPAAIKRRREAAKRARKSRRINLKGR